jgi:serpin B
MDELEERLTAFAGSGRPRGSEVIWKEAHRRLRRRAHVRSLRVGAGVALVIAVIVAVAVPNGSSRRPEPVSSASSEPLATFPRDATLARANIAQATGAGIDTSRLVTDNADFGVELYEKLRAAPGNLIVSPQSLATALAMTVVGAQGDTAAEILHALHASDPTQLSEQINALDQQLVRPRSGTPAPNGPNQVTLPGGGVPHDGSPARLTIDDSMWAQSGYLFYKTFLDTIARYYGTGVHLVDYQDNPEAARSAINHYIDAKTSGKIHELLPAGTLDSRTRFTLVNTLGFKGAWRFPFADDGAKPFQVPNGGTTDVAMMHTEAFTASLGPGYQAIRLPYVGGVTMTIVVPDVGRFEEIERNLGAELARISATPVAQQSEVDLVLPKFAFSSAADVSTALLALGVRTAFSDAADFSKLTPGNDLRLTRVLQGAHIAVDERGTEAEAATAVVGELKSLPRTLTVDRPFLFTITDDTSGSLLFLGRVVNPKAH